MCCNFFLYKELHCSEELNWHQKCAALLFALNEDAGLLVVNDETGVLSCAVSVFAMWEISMKSKYRKYQKTFNILFIYLL